MSEIFKAIWGNTKLTRSLLAVGSLAGALMLLLTDRVVPEWYIATLASAMTYYFASRQADSG